MSDRSSVHPTMSRNGAEGTPPRLELRHITKRYPGVIANQDVSLRVAPGEIHAVLGENGAGKSTLMKVIYGAVQADQGEIFWNGQAVQIHSPAEARRLGISMVYQHFSLFDTLTAAENVWLGLESTYRLDEVRSEVERVGSTYGLPVDPDRPCYTLSVGERQRVEIIRALMTQPRLLILDEPTSVLTPQAVDKLFVTLRQLADEGCSILYISHKLDEIRALCTHCTVLRGGRVTGEVNPKTQSNSDLSRLMIGTEPARMSPRVPRQGPVVLSVKNLNLPAATPFATALKEICLDLQQGEILGVAGVSGNGQQELMAALSGEDARVEAGHVFLSGEDISRLHPGRRRDRGLHFVPEERLGKGAVPPLSLSHNTLLTRIETVNRFGWIRKARTLSLTAALIQKFRVKASGPGASARSLSGGNLQKFIVGREIDAKPTVLLISQPTWGVDVGAASQIRAELLALAEQGTAVLVVSDELDELFEICDRMVVMAQGAMSPPAATAELTVERVGEWMSGLWPQTQGALNAEA